LTSSCEVAIIFLKSDSLLFKYKQNQLAEMRKSERVGLMVVMALIMAADGWTQDRSGLVVGQTIDEAGRVTVG
jgi:hypothetical protein